MALDLSSVQTGMDVHDPTGDKIGTVADIVSVQAYSATDTATSYGDLIAPGLHLHVWTHAQKRVAADLLSSFDRLQQKTHGFTAGDFQECRHRRLEVGDQCGPDHLRLSAAVGLREGGFRWLDLHWLVFEITDWRGRRRQPG